MQSCTGRQQTMATALIPVDTCTATSDHPASSLLPSVLAAHVKSGTAGAMRSARMSIHSAADG